jgi:RNA polymerase primary sigma factor
MLILEGLVSSGIDARTVLLGIRPDPDNSTTTFPSSEELTPHRLEVVTRYVEQIERVEQEALFGRARKEVLRSLVQHRDLTRTLLAALKKLIVSGESRLKIDPRIRIGLAESEAAREELLLSNVGIVIRIARGYMGRGLSLDDLRQEGYIGLMRAIEKFDFRLGFRFVTYAAWWIRSYIARALDDTALEIRVPSYAILMQRKVRVAGDLLFEVSGDYPADEILARYLGIPEESVEVFSNVVKQPLSLELSRDRGRNNDNTLASTVADTQSPLPDEIVADGETAGRIEKLLKKLRPREQEMIRLRFGIGKNRDHTLQEVGDRFGLSRERVRQIEQEALNKLRYACARSPDDLSATSA